MTEQTNQTVPRFSFRPELDWWDAYDEPAQPTDPSIIFVPATAVVEPEPEPEPCPTCQVVHDKRFVVPHGHYSRYTNHGCRCLKCTNALRLYRQKYRQARSVADGRICSCGDPRCPRRSVRPIKHGISAYDNHRCRCEICVTAMREYQRKRRQRLRDEAQLGK